VPATRPEDDDVRPTRRPATDALPIVLALVLAACGGSDAADTTTTTAVESTTTMATTTEAPATTEATTTTAAPTTSAGDLPTELKGGTYLVGTEILPGVWIADECGCAWAVVDENGTETLGSGDDAVVPEDAYAMRLGGCTWTWGG
jgi:hypothetical protein